MTAEAILAFGMSLLEWTLSSFHMAGQAILLQLDAMVGEIVGHGRVVVPWPRQQRDKDNDGNDQADEDEIGLLRLEPHQAGKSVPYASFRSSAMWRTSTSPRSPFLSWIMQAGHDVATTCAPLSRMAARLRSKIFCEVS